MQTVSDRKLVDALREELAGLCRGTGLLDRDVVKQRRAIHLPFLQIVTSQLRAYQGRDKQEARYTAARDLILCAVEIMPKSRLPDDEREILRWLLNVPRETASLRQRQETLQLKVGKSPESLRPSAALVQPIMRELARYLTELHAWPCPSGGDQAAAGRATRKYVQLLEDAQEILTEVVSEPAVEQWRKDHGFVFPRMFQHYAPRAGRQTVPYLAFADIVEHRYERDARRHGGGKPLLNRALAKKLVQRVFRPANAHNFLTQTRKAMYRKQPVEWVLLPVSREWAPDWNEQPDLKLAARCTLETLYSIALEMEQTDAWASPQDLPPGQADPLDQYLAVVEEEEED